jgi:hypothetical protein
MSIVVIVDLAHHPCNLQTAASPQISRFFSDVYSGALDAHSLCIVRQAQFL